MAVTNSKPDSKGSILIVGGGISGITTAVEAAEAGCQVVLLEKNPYLGGRVAQMNKYFPKLCSPNCGLEINFRRIRSNPDIRVYTLAEIERVNGSPGDYEVTVKLNPRYVNRKCTACGECARVCPVERADEFNYGMSSTKAVYLPHELAFPLRYVIDGSVCRGSECAQCVEACQYDAIDLDMPPQSLELRVGSMVMATGWNPYDAGKIDNLGWGKVQNIITNVMMERLAAANGPTGGKIARPSDGKEVKKVAFIQCVGSRDENHLPYCSAVCCMASLKHARYVREQNADSSVYIFYIDLRAPGKHEAFLVNVQNDDNVSLIKGKVAKIEEDPATRDVIVEAEDILSGKRIRVRVDLAVLATGMVPAAGEGEIPFQVELDQNGFMSSEVAVPGVYSAGVAGRPADVTASVQDATGSALKAIQCIVGNRSDG